MCEVRRGRAAEQRAELAQALLDVCVETLKLRIDRLPVEFTQHAGDEMYRAGRGWAPDWTTAEARTLSGRADKATLLSPRARPCGPVVLACCWFAAGAGLH